jgi:lipid-A-disaccharide synthase-like uncharacterized protein
MVISEDVRALLYPLGILSTIAFTSRFLIQWMQSEKARRSFVSAPFWWLSIFGNGSYGIHALIQGQFFVCVVQAINGVIAARNLNLMSQAPWRLSTVLAALGGSLAVPTLLFLVFSSEDWFRIPTHAGQSNAAQVAPIWHFIGTLGVVLFASRFWIQWIHAEKARMSTLEKPFWYLSLIGALLSIFYFALIRDYIGLAGPLFGLIPYLRNLMLLNRKARNA